MILERKVKRTLLRLGIAGAVLFSNQLSSYIPKNNSREFLTEEKIQDNYIYDVWKNALDKIPEKLLQEKLNENLSVDLVPVLKPKKPSTLKEIVEQYQIPSSQRKSISKILENVKYIKCPNKDYAGRFDNNGNIEVERQSNSFIARGMATIYTEKECGGINATGGKILDNEYSVAINEALLEERMSLPALLYIKNLENQKVIYVVADNKGPYKFNKNGKALHDVKGNPIPNSSRIIDLSPRAAKDLGIFEGYKNGSPQGKGKVEVQYIFSLADYIKK